MLKIERASKSLAEISVQQGSVIAEVDVRFSGGLSINDARDAGRGAYVVANAEDKDIDPRLIHRALEIGGHSRVRARGRILHAIPVNHKVNNTLQELSDGTSVQMSEDINPQLLEDAPKPALVKANEGTALSRREVTRKFIMNVFSPSTEPAKFGIEDLVQETDSQDLQPAA